MKKQLLATSAIALGVAMAAPASAAEWNMKVGGYYSAGAAFADVGGSLTVGQDRDGLDVHTTGEIFFLPSITLDNGLTFGANVQLEAHASVGDHIDETFVYIRGDNLGTITIGSEDSEGYRHMTGAPTVTSMWINSPSISTFIPFSSAVTSSGFRTAMLSSYTEVAGNNDAERISYRTPSFNGFTVGVSYARDGAQDNSFADDIAPAGTLHDIFDIGAGYSGDLGNGSIYVGARWGTGDIEGAGSADTWGIGASVSMGSFSVGGSYTENDNPGTATDSSGWSFGVSLDTAGPWSFALSTYQGEIDAPGSQESYEAYKLGASRDLGPGVDLDLYVVAVEATNAVGGTVDGTAFGTQLNLSF